MNFKIDTKEKFSELLVLESKISANMTAEIGELLLSFMKNDVKNIVFRLRDVEEINREVINTILNVQRLFQENGISFVICEVQSQVLNYLNEIDLLDSLNIVPTLSEAWDMVQMEEIEREFLKD